MADPIEVSLGYRTIEQMNTLERLVKLRRDRLTRLAKLRLNRLERLVKLTLFTFGLIVILGLIAVISLIYQNIRHENINLAISILMRPNERVEAPVRAWAIEVLANGPVRASPEILEALKRVPQGSDKCEQ
jgi:hypothetical protein